MKKVNILKDKINEGIVKELKEAGWTEKELLQLTQFDIIQLEYDKFIHITKYSQNSTNANKINLFKGFIDLLKGQIEYNVNHCLRCKNFENCSSQCNEVKEIEIQKNNWNILIDKLNSAIFEVENFKSDQGQGKKKRETWTDQEKKQYIEEFITFRDSKEGKSLEDIKSLWDRNFVLKSESRIPKASALKSWIEDGKYTMTSIKKEDIPDLSIFIIN